MNLDEELLAATPKRGPQCTVCRWLDNIPADAPYPAEAWRARLAPTSGWTTAAIFKVARNHGYIGADTDSAIGRHRKDRHP